MGAILMDDAVIGAGTLIGARALIPPNMKIPKKSLVVGSPGKVIRQITECEREMILERPQEYIDLASIYLNE